ncbi:unnamed protein product [Rotaria sordida]|uniref:Uncharacterized protein n=1 Tax=Rotaria sordida TaxID=392033 RepID=A0A814S7J8_9BILA|nr:unnamed protein product [Rotaria sordida]CAF0987029.1 unnamed protein product [Rotaria sordida]CAF1019045.1 unnamed protein product [Rotaria sordida]CAF1141362.1 unnamed protein product [Rotaria sordida]CAF1142596.1 unnamed protein product [Rotaria sordida]
MSDNSIIIPEINHQQTDDDDNDNDENNDKKTIKPTENGRHLLNTSLSRNTKLSSRSPSPSPRPTSSGPPDRALNQKFHVAALTGNLNVLQELVTKARIQIDCRDKENSTALLLSCARGHYSCADYLLSNGADPNARRITGASPLYFAALYHHTRIVELLLNKYKAIVDLATFDGSAPLHVVCERGFTDIVQLLINSQANINAKMNDGTTSIMLACQNGHLSVVQILISTGQCNLNIQRLDGITPLFLVVQHGHETIFDYITENVDNIKETIDLAREDGATPLFKACQKGYESLVQKLLKYKPNLELLKNGESCLHAATMFNHAPIVRFLIDNGANPLLNNWEGMTAVDLAKEAQIKDILDILMKALAPKLSEHARQYLLHKSTRRSDADFDLDLVEHEERDEWKLYKSLKSAAELERLEEEIEHIPILPDIPTTKGKQTGANRQKSTRPHRYYSTPQK